MTCARPARTWKAGSFVAADGKTVQIPDAWVAAWKAFYQSIWTDHTALTGPQFQNTDINPGGYPFFTGKVAMATNYLWSLYGIKDAGDDWNMAATPSYQGQTTAAFNADTFRILKSSKHPDEAFKMLTCLLRNEDLLKLYGGMPAVESKQDAFLQSLQATTRNRSTGTSRRRASSSLTCRTSSRTPRPTTRRWTCSPSSIPSGRPRRPRHRCRGRRPQDPDAGHLGRGRQLTMAAPSVARPRTDDLASPGWPGGARAGGTSSSRRGSSGSSRSRLFPMIATLAFTFTNINLTQAEPLRFVGLDNWAKLARRSAAWESLAVTLKFALSRCPWRSSSRSSWP